jgi:hypothetical protein
VRKLELCLVLCYVLLLSAAQGGLGFGGAAQCLQVAEGRLKVRKIPCTCCRTRSGFGVVMHVGLGAQRTAYSWQRAASSEEASAMQWTRSVWVSAWAPHVLQCAYGCVLRLSSSTLHCISPSKLSPAAALFFLTHSLAAASCHWCVWFSRNTLPACWRVCYAAICEAFGVLDRCFVLPHCLLPSAVPACSVCTTEAVLLLCLQERKAFAASTCQIPEQRSGALF